MNVGQARASFGNIPDPPANTNAQPAGAPPPTGAPPPPPGHQPPDAPTPPDGDPAKVKLPSGGNWTRYAARLGTAATVGISAFAIRKGGHEPNEPDNEDCNLLVEALDEGLKLQYGSKEIPWWLGAAMAAGGVYTGMRVGAAKSEPTPEEQTSEVAAKMPPPMGPAGKTIVPDHAQEPEPGEKPTLVNAGVFSKPMSPTAK